jgi:hypothetical protein
MILPLDLQTEFSQRWNGGVLDDRSGTSAANAGDVNGDGTPDVVMGAASGAGDLARRELPSGGGGHPGQGPAQLSRLRREAGNCECGTQYSCVSCPQRA